MYSNLCVLIQPTPKPPVGVDNSPPVEGILSRQPHAATTPSGCAAAYKRDTIAPVYLYWTSPLHRRGIPPRQAAPPRANATQSPQCICTGHLPSTGGEYHPVRLRRRVQTHTIAPVYLYWTSSLHRRGIALPYGT